MATYCDACEHKLNDLVSKCCGEDVWAELWAYSTKYLCQGCGNECELVEASYKKDKK